MGKQKGSRSGILSAVWICCALSVCGAGADKGDNKLSALGHSPRTWTSVNGNVLQAAFEGEAEGKVYLRLANGTTVATTRAKLSPNDLAWIDALSNSDAADAKTLSFSKVTMRDTLEMVEYRRIKRVFLHSYANREDNDRNDKMLGFLKRDAQKIFGWSFIDSECYRPPQGRGGRVKKIVFTLQSSVPLQEGVEIVRDKFGMVLGETIFVKESVDRGRKVWEVQGGPDYVSRVLLVAGYDRERVMRFEVQFPPPK